MLSRRTACISHSVSAVAVKSAETLVPVTLQFETWMLLDIVAVPQFFWFPETDILYVYSPVERAGDHSCIAPVPFPVADALVIPSESSAVSIYSQLEFGHPVNPYDKVTLSVPLVVSVFSTLHVMSMGEIVTGSVVQLTKPLSMLLALISKMRVIAVSLLLTWS